MMAAVLGLGSSLVSCQQQAAFITLTSNMDGIAVKDAGNFLTACGVEAVIRKNPDTEKAFEKAVKIIDILVEDGTAASTKDAVVTAVNDKLLPVFGEKVTRLVIDRVTDLYDKALNRVDQSNTDWREVAVIVQAGIENGIKLTKFDERPVYLK